MSRTPREAALAYANNGYYLCPVSADGRVLGAASKGSTRVGGCGRAGRTPRSGSTSADPR